MKPCKTCGDPKDLSDFYKCASARDGHQNICKLCAKEDAKEYRKNNKDCIAKHEREYRIANRVHIYERVRRQFLGDPKKRAERAERARIWRLANPKKVAEQRKRRNEKRKLNRKNKRSLTTDTPDPIVVAGVSIERADA